MPLHGSRWSPCNVSHFWYLSHVNEFRKKYLNNDKNDRNVKMVPDSTNNNEVRNVWIQPAFFKGIHFHANQCSAGILKMRPTFVDTS